ncbi:MAG TPA: hypothetical protein VMZ29_04490 [Candidatus Bathyarchaeia archaeon]|nr:hypothetical protein [Candidatus Bathyarchaeia archaeon]
MKKRMSFLIVVGIISVMLMSTVTVMDLLGANLDSSTDVDQNSTIKAADQSIYYGNFETKAISEGFAEIGTLDVDYGNAYRIYRSGNILYISGLTGGATFIDVTDPFNPIVLANYVNGGTVYDTVYYQGYCYIATAEKGLECLDIRIWENILSLGSYYGGGQAYDIEFIGLNTMYVADGTGGLKVFNTRYSKTNFTLAREEHFGVTAVYGVQADPLHNIAFLMCGTDGVVVLDTTRPLTPVVLDILKDGPTNSRQADMSAFKLYVADGANGLKVYDYENQDNITYVGNFTIAPGEYAENFKWDVLRKGFLSVRSGVYLLNITNLSAITQRWKKSYSPGNAIDVAINSRIIYLANEYNLILINLSDADNPIIYSSIIFAGEPRTTDVQGDLGVLAEGFTGIDLINLTDLSNPILIAKFLKEGVTFFHAILNNTLIYAATNYGLEIINITDVLNPVSIGSLNAGEAHGLAFRDNIVYLATRTAGLRLINVANPTTPSLIRTVGFATETYRVSLEGNYAFVSRGLSGFSIINVTIPASAYSLSTYTAGAAVDGLCANDTVLAVAATTSGVVLYNISDITSLTVLDTILDSGYNVSHVDIYEDKIYVTANDDGLYEMDASDPTALTLERHFYEGGSALYVTVVDEIAFVANEVNSFEIVGRDDDLDRLSNYIEVNLWGTDPNADDTDGDGLLDGDEVDYWILRGVDPLSDFDGDTFPNILDIDSDDDTISDGDEINIWGSDPINLDSDADGLSDEDEVNTYGTNPASSDSDTDDLTDYEEIKGVYAPTNPAANATGYILGLNPLNPDTDGDGAWDGWEVYWGYNPLVNDGGLDDDGDLLNTTWEFLYHTNPYNPDTDGDELTDGDEVFTYGTNPTKWDTDGDLIDDKFEIENGLNPLDKADGQEDRDGDGLTNYEEYFWGTDLDNPDTDGDLLPDKWEVYYNTDPLHDDADQDDDNDGLTNYEEYLYGTYPNDPDSDDDGFTDYHEIQEGTDPLDPNDHPDKETYTESAGFGFITALIIIGVSSLGFIIYRKRK